MIDKTISRLRRAAKTRATIARLKAVRMTVHRTNTHIYAQIIDATGAKVLAAASTVEKEVIAAYDVLYRVLYDADNITQPELM